MKDPQSRANKIGVLNRKVQPNPTGREYVLFAPPPAPCLSKSFSTAHRTQMRLILSLPLSPPSSLPMASISFPSTSFFLVVVGRPSVLMLPCVTNVGERVCHRVPPYDTLYRE